MATFYMNENHPSLIMAEQSPGPGWTKAKRTDGHRGNQDATPVASLPALVLGVASELAKSEELRRQVFAESEPKPVKSFGELVTSVMASERLSYGDAARKVSMERPDLYAEHRAQAYL